MPADLDRAMFAAIKRGGYHPQVIAASVEDALADERVQAYVVHHEPTFDRDQVRRHMTVLVLTATRLLLVHTDEHPADDIVPESYTATSTEAVPVSAIASVIVTRMVPESARTAGEAVLTIGWGTVAHLDLEPARCADPDCDADHGYTGSLTRDDFTLRISAAADGEQAVEQLLDFARRLSHVTR